MELVFVPSQCKGENKKYDGSVTLKALTHSERLRILAKTQLNLTDLGVEKMDTSKLDGVANLLDAAKPFVVKVEIKNLVTNEMYNSYESLEYDAELLQMLVEISGQVLSGLKLGNA